MSLLNTVANISSVYAILSFKIKTPLLLFFPAKHNNLNHITIMLSALGKFSISIIFSSSKISEHIFIHFTSLANSKIPFSNSWIFQKCLSQFNFNSIDFQFSIYWNHNGWNAVYFFQFNQSNFIRLDADCCIWCCNFCSF